MLPPSGDMLQVLSTFSAVGFVITFGLPTIMATGYDLMRKSMEDALTNFVIRFIGMFTDFRVFVSFISLSILFMASGCLCIGYYLSSYEMFVEVALWLEIVAMVGTIIAVICIAVAARRPSLSEIQKVMEYTRSHRASEQ